MNQSEKRIFMMSGILLLLFIVFTVMIKTVDVQAIGPEGSAVGLAAINGRFHKLFGLNTTLYQLSEVLGYIGIASAIPFIIIGLMQLIGRRSFARVDATIYALAVFYAVVVCVYLLFEVVVINYRPELMEGVLEASYPSSHTLLSVCFFSAAIIESGVLTKYGRGYKTIQAVGIILMALLVITRMLCGVHWLTDVIGALLISAALVTAFDGVIQLLTRKRREQKQD